MAKYDCLVFRGSEQYLKDLVTKTAGIDGYWREIDDNSIQFVPARGGNLQWWRSTRNAVVNGNWHPEDKARLIETIPTLHPEWRKRYAKMLKAKGVTPPKKKSGLIQEIIDQTLSSPAAK